MDDPESPNASEDENKEEDKNYNTNNPRIF